MNKGNPYLIQFHSVYPTPERYRISIIHRSKVPQVTAMEVVNKKSTDGYPAGFGEIYAGEFVDVKLTYQNGGSTILPAGKYDAYGNRTSLSLSESTWDEHGATQDYNLELYTSFLPGGENEPDDEDGSYEMPSMSIPVQLQFSSDISSLKELDEGRSLCKTSDKQVEYYLFRPKTDGTYSFDTDNGYIRLGELNDSEIDLFYSYGYNNLKAGHTYIIEANRKLYGKTSDAYDMQASEYYLDVIHYKNVTKLELLNPPDPFVSPYQNPGAGTKIKAIYEDSTEAIITGQSEKDFFGNYLRYTYQVISNEKARVCISFGNQSIYCDVSRLPVSSLPKLTLGKASELTTTLTGEIHYYSQFGVAALFVPQKSSVYRFDVTYTGKQKEKPSIFIYDAETESLVENRETLLAGHAYVICADCSEWFSEQSVQMSVSERSSGTVNPCASGHTWNGGTVTKQPTALAAGIRTFRCSACGAQKTETIAKLTPTLSVNAKKLPLKIRQSTNKLKISNLAAGDYVVSYASSNPKIAKVSQSGKITAGKKAGKAIITITLASGKKEKITVQVQKKAVKTQKISGLNKKLSLKKGKKAALKPVITPITSLEKVTYRTSNKKVATVNKKGVIQAKKPGKAKITVKSGKKKFTVTLTVKK